MPILCPLPASGSYATLPSAPAALSLVETGYFDSGSTKVTDIDFTPNAIQQGDLLLAFLGNDGGHALSSSPSGSTQIGSELNNGATTFRQYQMTLTGSEGTLTWTLSSSNQAKAYFLVFRNTDTSNPIADNDGVSEFSSSTGVSLPALDVTTAGSAFVHGLVHDVDGAVPTITRPSQVSAGDMEVEDAGEAYSVGLHVAVEYPSVGSTGSRDWGISPADSNQALGAIIQPGSTVVTPPPSDPTAIEEVPGVWAYIESGISANNSASSGDLLLTENIIAAGPTAKTEAAQRVAYTANRQNSKHGWVFGSDTDHLVFDTSLDQDNFDSFGAYVAVVIKPDGLGNSASPRLWAQSDTVYLYLEAGEAGSAHKLGFYRRFADSDAYYISQNDVVSNGSPQIVEVIWDASAPTVAPAVRLNGSNVQMNAQSAGRGAAVQTTGKRVYVGNRQENEDITSFLDRGYSGDMYALVMAAETPTLQDQKTVLDELAASWNIAVSNPFFPSIEAQSFTVRDGSSAGATVGLVVTNNAGESPAFSLTGSATSYFEIGASTGLISVKSGVTLPAIGTQTSGTVTIDNGVGTADASITVSVVEASTLKYSRPPALIAPTRTVTTYSGNKILRYRPNTDGEHIEILAPSGSSVSQRSFRVDTGDTDLFGSVLIYGGHYIATDNAAIASQSQDAVWSIETIKGDLFVEGVRLTAGERQDGIQFGIRLEEFDDNVSGNFYFQNIGFENIKGPEEPPHGDFIQSRGAVQSVYVDNFYGETGYQGFFLDGVPNNKNYFASIDGEVIITNGDAIRIENIDSENGKYYGKPDGTGTGDVGGFVWWLDNYSGSNAWRVGHATDRTIDSVWCQKYTGVDLTKDPPTTPPNRMFWPWENGEANRVVSGGEEWLDLFGNRGFVNIGDRPGGPLFVEGPNPGKNYSLNGSTDIIAGMGYGS